MDPAAPKSIFRVILICAAFLYFTALAPSALAQKGGSRGGGGSHGGGSHASGGAHAGSSHGGGGFQGGSVHSGGPYGGFGVSTHSAGSGSVSMAGTSSSNGHGSSSVGFARRMNFTGNTFVAPPAAVARPVEGAARTIFINARPEFEQTSVPTGARPFAAGNYLWEAPPQQRTQQRVATPPAPAAPRPVTAPAPQPIHPTVMQPPSPIRPMSLPSPTPMQIPGSFRAPGQMPIARPAAIPVSPMPMPMPISRPVSPVMSRPIASPVRPMLRPIQRPMFGGKFVAPPLRVPGLVTPASRPILAGPVPPMSHPPVLPVRPFAGMSVEPGTHRRPITPFTAFEGSNATPPHPCINTITRCGFGGGVLDGDGDFDNDGFGPSIFFGFLGPFGFSPLGFGSTCIFDGFFQNCFLSPVNFSPFGFGAFGPFGLYGSWYGGYNFAPYGSSFLSMPPVDNLPPAFGDYLPNTNYAPAYIFEPEPLPVPEEAPPSANASEAIQPVVNLVLKDGTVFGVTSYWLVNDRLFYITTYKIQSSIPIGQLDLQKTVDMNWKRGVAFTLTPQAPQQNPEPQPH